MSGSDLFSTAVYVLLAYAALHIALLDPIRHIVRYQTIRHRRLAGLSRLLDKITHDTQRWEPDDPATTPGPAGGIGCLLVIGAIFSIWMGPLHAAVGLTLLGIFAAGQYCRSFNETQARRSKPSGPPGRGASSETRATTGALTGARNASMRSPFKNMKTDGKRLATGCLLPLAAMSMALWCLIHGWPTSGWLLALIAATWSTGWLQKQLIASTANEPPRFTSRLAVAVLGGLQESGTYVAIGMASVVVLQLFLGFATSWVEPELLHTWEERLSDLREWTEQVTSLKSLMMGLIVVALLAPHVPRLKLWPRFFVAHNLASKLLHILIGMTSFTFFAASAVDAFDRDYVAFLMSKRLNEPLARIRASQERIIAVQFIVEQARLHPDVTVRKMAELLRKAAREHCPDCARKIGKMVGDSLGALPEEMADARASATLFDARNTQVLEWLHDDNSTSRPTIRKMEQFELDCERVKHEESDGEKAALAIAQSTLGALLPEIHPEILSPFVESLVEAAADALMGQTHQYVHGAVSDLASAHVWLHTSDHDKQTLPIVASMLDTGWQPNEHETSDTRVPGDRGSDMRDFKSDDPIKRDPTRSKSPITINPVRPRPPAHR
jgi:hypothetical protein